MSPDGVKMRVDGGTAGTCLLQRPYPSRQCVVLPLIKTGLLVRGVRFYPGADLQE